MFRRLGCIALAGLSLVAGCKNAAKVTDKPIAVDLSATERAKVDRPFAERLNRTGQEIMVCGQLYHIGAPVVLWTDPGGYDAYRTERRFAPWREASYAATTRAAATRPNITDDAARYGLREFDHHRQPMLTPEELERVRGGGWDLPLLQRVVDQFVMHYDVCGVSRTCFMVLHDMRGLSVQFMLDIDGTIYQTMDLKERAWHATVSNSRSIGIEIANMGAYSTKESLAPLQQWYSKDAKGQTYITVPERLNGGGVRVPGTYRPARNDLVVGTINGTTYRQYDLTPQQYDSLIKLTAALSVIFPQITLDYPRDAQGKLLMDQLSPEQFDHYKGVLGHWHVQKEKQDPGPAFQWDTVIEGARKIVGTRPKYTGPIAPPTTRPVTRPTITASR
jgi:N-acetyl-anhydromuramyl-L-alanine amidase AmpD